jgi:hypothetical protein
VEREAVEYCSTEYHVGSLHSNSLESCLYSNCGGAVALVGEEGCNIQAAGQVCVGHGSRRRELGLAPGSSSGGPLAPGLLRHKQPPA